MKEKQLTYQEAFNRLNEIINKIEEGEISIDELSEKVKEAKRLFDFCQKKLTEIEDDLNDILKDIPDSLN